jgi:2-oxoglutarate ferredoxin oxidoreductase subunit delta
MLGAISSYLQARGEIWESKMALFKAEKKQFTKNAGKWDVVIGEDMCKACGFCLNVCPVEVFDWRKSPNKLGWVPMFVATEQNCIGCMLCYQICPDFCINVSPKEVAAPAVS